MDGGLQAAPAQPGRDHLRGGRVHSGRFLGVGRRQPRARQQAGAHQLVDRLRDARREAVGLRRDGQVGRLHARARNRVHRLGTAAKAERPRRGQEVMYKTIYVPVDNSDHSNQAIRLGIELGSAFASKMVGCHVYAAKMHDYRFKQMEYTLPEEYLEETELERQRKIHDSLITMGLKLISDSYLSPMATACTEAALEFEPRMMDGKHSTEIVKDLAEGEYDLVVLGVLGLGRVRDSQVGSVCERVTRRAKQDVLVVKRVPTQTGDSPLGNGDSPQILVGIDGSPPSFGAPMTAIELGKRFGKEIEAIAVYDPYLHYTVFNGIVNVLTEKAAKVFRFEEQNQLHEEVIDTGLAQIYQSHLDVAEKMAAAEGVSIKKTLLDGKAFQKILNHARKTEPWLLVVGRTGIHSASDENRSEE